MKKPLLGGLLVALALLAGPVAAQTYGTRDYQRNTAVKDVAADPAPDGATTAKAAVVVCAEGCASPVTFAPEGAASLSVTTTSDRVALGTGGNVLLRNNGSADLYYDLGDSTVTATTSEYLLPAGHSIVVAKDAHTHVAAITASGSTTLSVTTGDGTPTISGGGGTGGGGDASAALQSNVQDTFGAVDANRSVIFDSSGNAVDWTAAVPVTDNGGSLTVDGSVSLAAAIPAGSNLIGQVTGSGTAGTAASGVLTVQGIASMTPVQVSQATASNLNAQVVGPAADDAAASGNPVPVGGIYNSTLPTYTALDRAQLQHDAKGNLRTILSGNITAPSDNNAFYTQPFRFDSTSNTFPLGVGLHAVDASGQGDAVRTIEGSLTANTGVLAGATAPAASTRISTNSTVDGIKTGAGSLERVCIGVKGATGNLLTLYDNTTATGTVLAVIDTTDRVGCLEYSIRFATGLSAILATGTAADVVISRR